MNISIIVAADEHNGIGKDNQLLWHISEDLKYFKKLTSGHSIIMGRKTYDSIGKPLPNRRNIVISRQTDLSIPGCEVVHALEQALVLCQQETEVFIIGGAEIFKHSIDLADTIYLTQVHAVFEADTFFPKLDAAWKTVNSIAGNDEGELKYTFVTLRKTI